MNFNDGKRSWHLCKAVDLVWVVTDTGVKVEDESSWAVEDDWSEDGSGLGELSTSSLSDLLVGVSVLNTVSCKTKSSKY